jgi:hypothetical protein
MTEPNSYDLGDLVRVTGAFKDAAGEPIDPTAVSFKLRDPTGAVTTFVYGVAPALVKDSTGHYHIDVSASMSGTWRYRWESTGAGQAAEEGAFVVAPSGLV